MITTKIVTICVCDVCGATVEDLKNLYIDDLRPYEFRSTMCEHQVLFQMCLDCWNGVMKRIGPIAQERLIKLKSQADSYRF
jgi:hypothetical protein